MVKFNTVEEIGVVRSVNGEVATVCIPKKTGCEGCTLKACKTEEQFMVLEALNPVKAVIGQRVKVAMRPYTYLKGSLIIYGIPALALIAGAFIGKEVLSPHFGRLDPDTVSAVFGFGAFAVSFILIKLWSRKVSNKPESKPVIEEIIQEA